MKILILSPNIPYPVNSGNRIRTWAFIEALARGHRVSVLCFENRADSQASAAGMKTACENIWWTPNYKAGISPREGRMRKLAALLRGIPWEVASAYSPDFERKLLEISGGFDMIIARYISTGRYLLNNRAALRARLIVDFDDLEFIKAARAFDEAGYSGPYDRFRKTLNNLLLRRYYRRFRSFAGGIVCSEHDKRLLRECCGLEHISVIPNAIDAAKYRGVKPYDGEQARKKTIFFCGNLNYPPNLDGILWFIRDVFPLVRRLDPGVRLLVAGLSKKNDIMKYHDGSAISISLNVPAIEPLYDECSIVVVPLKVGGGTRIKILEAFACRRPVVSTAVGAEGIEAENGRHIAIADEPAELAQACLRLLENEDAAKRMADEAFALVNARYDVRTVADKIAAELILPS